MGAGRGKPVGAERLFNEREFSMAHVRERERDAFVERREQGVVVRWLREK